MFCVRSKILENKKIAEEHYKLTISSKEIAESAKPGQFIQIKIEEVFLRRPFSIHKTKDEKLEIIYKIVGRATETLSKYKKGKEIDIIGPLGNGFGIPFKNCKFIFAGGGYGISPLYFFAERIVNNFSAEDIFVFIGAKKKKYIICEEEFKNLGCKLYISTEDGSKGYKGKITEFLNFKLSEFLSKHYSFILYSCGPYPMLKEVAKIARINNIKCYVSLEEIICCGFGACLGCAVKTKYGYKLVCKDGPVFDAEEIIWK